MIKEFISRNSLYNNPNGYNFEDGMWEDAIKDFKEKIKKEKVKGFIDDRFEPFKDKSDDEKAFTINNIELLQDKKYKITVDLEKNINGNIVKEFEDELETNMHYIVEAEGQEVQEISEITRVNLVRK